MIKKKLFVWVCDYSEDSGEGRLARLFVKKLNSKKQYKIKLNQKKVTKTRYISTLQGIVYCWTKYFKNEKVCYLNYLPFWNFLIFILLPPKTILGPITGGANYSKLNLVNFVIRGVIFPLFYKISEFFLILRKIKIVFSTDLLKKYLFLNTIKKSEFNFVLNSYSLKKKKRKKIDILIYYRKHKNKEIFFPYNFVRKLVSNEFKVHVIGDRLNVPFAKNYGKITNKKVLQLQSLANYTLSSDENFYSFFIIECLSNNVKVIVNKKNVGIIKSFKNQIIKIDYNKTNDLKKLEKL